METSKSQGKFSGPPRVEESILLIKNNTLLSSAGRVLLSFDIASAIDFYYKINQRSKGIL